MSSHARSSNREAENKSLIGHIKSMSRRNKLIGIALIIFLVLTVVSIPGDRAILLTRQERVETAQIAYDLTLPAVGPAMESIVEYLDSSGVDLTGNRLYSGLGTASTSFNRPDNSHANRFQAVTTFSGNVHSLLEGTNAVAELNTEEFRALVTDMDPALSVAFLALMELNTAIDEYNGYQSWLSAKAASALFGLPQGYPDPVPANSRLNRATLP